MLKLQKHAKNRREMLRMSVETFLYLTIHKYSQ